MDLLAKQNYISLFSGAGGLDLSIRLAMPRAKCSCHVEIDAPAAAILASRLAEGSLDDCPIWSDVTTFDGTAWRGRVDGIIGGFPCTDLSVAGKQEGIIEGNRSGLFFEYARIIREVQPGWVLLENVPPVLAHPAGGIVLGELAKLGLDAEWLSLRASDVGAPHQRKRVFILAYRPERGFGVLREPSGSSGLTDGSNQELAHSEPSDGRAEHGEHGNPYGRNRLGRSGFALDDTPDARLSGWKPGESTAEGDGARMCEPGGRCDAVAATAAGSYSQGGTGLFPPGPSDRNAWEAILRDHPELAPAISEEEAQQWIRLLDDGLADGVAEFSRVDQLRAAGNGVVALQGAAALIILARRIAANDLATMPS